MFKIFRHSLLKVVTAFFLSIALVFPAGPAMAFTELNPGATAGTSLNPNIDEIIEQIPQGDRWIQHLNDDLLPFWAQDSAYGEPQGNYPTYRCNDGTVVNWADPCDELKNADGSIVKSDREYIRAQSRQIFAYSVAYQLTGNNDYLQLAKDGADYLRDHGLDEDGAAYTYYDLGNAGAPGPAQDRRISQDMAYAVAGLGYYYYVTRDPAVLQEVITLKDYIFNTYYDAEWDLLGWSKSDYVDSFTKGDGTPGTENVAKNQRELVAQLDQMYGYLLFLAPALPDSTEAEIAVKEKWEEDLLHIAEIMSNQFYSPDKNLFWGAITDTGKKQLETDHADFGHTVKTLWLIYQTGRLTGHTELVNFAEERIPAILKEAYLADGTWGRRPNKDGTIQETKEWWILAELDQASAIMGLKDPSYAEYLTTTYDYWFDKMVDHDNGGIWHQVNADGTVDYSMPKQHSWKNAFHSFEHDLIGYITGQAIHDLPVSLYFALPDPDAIDFIKFKPYIFGAKVDQENSAPCLVDTNICSLSYSSGSWDEPVTGHYKYKMEFNDIH